jgi:hypothetical protein
MIGSIGFISRGFRVKDVFRVKSKLVCVASGELVALCRTPGKLSNKWKNAWTKKLKDPAYRCFLEWSTDGRPIFEIDEVTFLTASRRLEP